MTRTPLINPIRLTWAKDHNKYLVGYPLFYPAALRAKYELELRTLAAYMTSYTRKRIINLFTSDLGDDYFYEQKELAAMDESLASQARILTNALTKKFEALFTKKAQRLSEKMIAGADTASKSGLKSSLQQLAGELSLKLNFIPSSLKEVSNASIAENVSLIKSIPDTYFNQITGAVMRSITTGGGVKSLMRHFKKYDDMTDRRAKNIALDQTRKAYNSINVQRMMASGYKKFRWLHSGGGMHPRPLHVAMNGKVYSFDDLPVIDKVTGEKGIPGQLPNCGCTLQPVYEFPGG
jgi:SPP1 gp7 family putative phage head morphogenesis protein